MSDKASTDNSAELPNSLQKEAVDALALLKEADRKEAFDYFQALIEFQKHASDAKRS